MDVTPKSEAYISRWQYLRFRTYRNNCLTRFRRIPIGGKFTLPGGTTEQTKLTGSLAIGGDRLMSYKGWERVRAV